MTTVTHVPATVEAPFTARFIDPPAFGLGDLDGRRLWLNTTHLAATLTETGAIWLRLRSPAAPIAKDGLLPGRRRLWNAEGAIRPLHGTDGYIAVCCGDDGQASEVWAVPTDAAYAASRSLPLDAAAARLFDLWEAILDDAGNNTGSTIVVAFDLSGLRHARLDLE